MRRVAPGVEGPRPGDALAVTLHRVDVGDWGWSAVVPGFGFLSEEFAEPYLKTCRFSPGDSTARFDDRIRVLLRPCPGVVGVAHPARRRCEPPDARPQVACAPLPTGTG